MPISTRRNRLTNLFRMAGAARSTQGPTEGPVTMEVLESRVLLSAMVELPDGVEARPWRGGLVPAIENSWIATFDRSVTKQTLTAEFSKVIFDLGIALDGFMHRGNRFVEFITPDPLHEGAIDIVRAQLGNLVNIEPNIARAPMRVPNDPGLGQQWWVENTGQPIPGQLQGTPGADIRLPAAWDITTGSSGVVVAVVDTGVEWYHPDLAGNIWSNPSEIPGNGIDDDGNGFIDDIRGWDFGTATFGPGGTGAFGGDNDPDDNSLGGGHGTAVAGTIGAIGNNAFGIAGVNWDVSILPIKIANQQGALVGGAIIAAHQYLTDLKLSGVNIVASNNSYGAFSPAFFAEFEEFDFERQAIEDLIAAGVTFVAAAGNDSNDNDDVFTAFPAAYDLPGIISVAATNNRDELASFSNFGATTVDVAAPGEAILTTTTGGAFTYIDGTSFASPIVAGIVALMKSVRPDLTPEQVAEALIASSDPIPALQGRVVANGRVNAARALQYITTDGPIVLQVSPGAVTGAPISQLQVSFSKPVQSLPVDVLSRFTLIRAGGDGTFFDGNEVAVNLASASLDSTRTVLTLTPLGSISAIDRYRLVLDHTAIRDDDGNFLNGDMSSGQDLTYEFNLIVAPGIGEPNDTLTTATPAIIPGGGNGTVTFTGRTIGDGVHAGRDVDIYRLDLPRGGLISARIFAQTLPTPSRLDAVLRLFDGTGQELAINDQFFGNDPFIDYFVPSAGVYYVGVSGFGNESYLPLIAGSGQTQSTGNYDLRLDVALVDDASLRVSSAFPIPGQIIPDQSVLIDSIVVSDARDVKDVNVTINIVHPFVSDLYISLVGPGGQQVDLVRNIGGSADNFTFTVFNDQAPRSITSATSADAPFTGGWRPLQPLSVFNDQSAAGQWQLIIRDTKGNDVGSLLEWSLDFVLENDIFGPFELNDTLTTARVIEPALGTVTLNAFIGDGAFGASDVDLFQFQAAAGSTLVAQANSGGIANVALRLFDSAGNELQSSSPAGELNAAIEGFVFVDGGTYYIGVSDAVRAEGAGAYNPTIAGSGVPGESVGNYTLRVSLASGVSDPGVSLAGDRLDVAISPSGAFGLDDAAISFAGVEFFPLNSQGNRRLFFGIGSEGGGFVNDGVGSSQDVPFNVVSQSTPTVNRVSISGVSNGFRMDRTVSYAQGDGFIAVDVVLTNTTSRVARNVLWAEGFNPDQDFGVTGSRFTINDVVDGLPLAVASGTTGRSIALGADPDDSRASAFFSSISGDVRSPQSVVDRMVEDPNGVSSDLLMALGYDLGDLNPGQSTTMRYFIFLSDLGQAGIDGPNGLYATATATRADGQRLDRGLLTFDPTQAADDDAGLADLAFRTYYPEGFANSRASTFVPITNPTNTDARVVVIVRYEDPSIPIRDQVIFDGVVAANTRSPDALTITTPDLYAQGSTTNVFNPVSGQSDGVFKDTPYALEIRSSVPVAATMSHFDFGFSTGEAFSAQASEIWSFSGVSIGQGINEFITFQNTTDEVTKVSMFLFPQTGSGGPVELVFTLDGYRRGGWNLNAELASGLLAGKIQPGVFGVTLIATEPIVAARSSFGNGGASSQIGTPNLGSTQGAIAEGQVGLSSQSETISVFNPSSGAATVTLQFIFATGGSIRQTVQVASGRVSQVNVSDIPLFPSGSPYGVFFESNQSVIVSSNTRGLGESLSSASASNAHSFWAFSEGFAPIQGGQVSEYLRVFNPGLNDTLLEITFRFTDGQTETFRRTAGAASVSEFNLRQFISTNRFQQAQAGGAPGVFYGFTVKSSSGIVAYQGRTDQFLGGSFGTLGTPLGIVSQLA